ncbi:hypothetical protein GH5_03168 [Leishmania sp. Ghana 2012 LV757]|uniref:hypothetical protein n=1 Tax=Leishmania sp. Ghana 2012 LV757 TaxID=2803181 RepID=UPI001B6165D8|nr:hypothetical protein GH5_03168 [Leishmania sp. Ghana 2012 LV757]
MPLPLSGFTPDSPLITAEPQRNTHARVRTSITKGPCWSLASLNDRLTPDAVCANDSASCSRGESLAVCMRSPTQREVVPVVTGASHLTLRESLSLLSDLSFRPEVDGAAATPLVLSSEEELENVSAMAAVLSQPQSPWLTVSSSGESHPTLHRECVTSAAAKTLQGLGVPAGLSTFSPTSAMSAASSPPDRLHGAGLIRLNSAPALRGMAKGRTVQVLGSPPEVEVDRPHPAALKIAALTLSGPIAHHRDDPSTTQLQDEASLTSSSGLCTSCLRAPTSIPGAVFESVAAVAFAGVGAHEFSLCSPSSSMLTFVDHELDIATDPAVLHLGDSLLGVSEAGSLLDSEGGLRPSGTRHYLLAGTHSPLSSGPVMSFASKSNPQHRCRPAVVTSVAQSAQFTPEYAAAVQAAAAYGRSLRQILARRSDDADDALRDSAEMSSEI